MCDQGTYQLFRETVPKGVLSLMLFRAGSFSTSVSKVIQVNSMQLQGGSKLEPESKMTQPCTPVVPPETDMQVPELVQVCSERKTVPPWISNIYLTEIKRY